MIDLNIEMFEKEILPALIAAERINSSLYGIKKIIEKTSFFDSLLLKSRIESYLKVCSVLTKEEYKNLLRAIDVLESEIHKKNRKRLDEKIYTF